MTQKTQRKIAPKVWFIFVTGLFLFISGILILEFGGHRNHLKGGLLVIAGFIVGGAYAVAIFQTLRAARSSDLKDSSKNDTSSEQKC